MTVTNNWSYTVRVRAGLCSIACGASVTTLIELSVVTLGFAPNGDPLVARRPKHASKNGSSAYVQGALQGRFDTVDSTFHGIRTNALRIHVAP